jgi:hypothetical protein
MEGGSPCLAMVSGTVNNYDVTWFFIRLKRVPVEEKSLMFGFLQESGK